MLRFLCPRYASCMRGIVLVCLLCVGCEAGTVSHTQQDLASGLEALQARHWSLAERILERYLRDEENMEKRWEAWQYLFQASKSGGANPRALLDMVEMMLAEFADDPHRAASLLKHMGEINENMRRYERAAEIWTSYVEHTHLAPAELVATYRRLARIYFTARRFDLGEDVLQNCLAVAVQDADKARCLYDLADMSAARERWKEAIDLGTQVLELDVPGDVRGLTLFLLGDALEQEKKPKEALRYFEQARGLYPNEQVVENRIAFLKKSPQK